MLRTALSRYYVIALFNIAYIVGFGAYYLIQQNYEFLWYIAVLTFFLVVVGATLHRTQFSFPILWLLSIWGLLHMAGGGIVVNGGVLYALHLVPIAGSGEAFILKYDQAVHFYGFFVTTFVLFHLIVRKLGKNAVRPVMFVLCTLGSMGLGAVNELVEFAAVVTFPQTGVGGYFNTALDLLFNGVGAIAAGMVLYARSSRRPLQAAFSSTKKLK